MQTSDGVIIVQKGENQKKRDFARPRHRWEDTVKKDPKEIEDEYSTSLSEKDSSDDHI